MPSPVLPTATPTLPGSFHTSETSTSGNAAETWNPSFLLALAHRWFGMCLSISAVMGVPTILDDQTAFL